MHCEGTCHLKLNQLEKAEQALKKASTLKVPQPAQESLPHEGLVQVYLAKLAASHDGDGTRNSSESVIGSNLIQAYDKLLSLNSDGNVDKTIDLIEKKGQVYHRLQEYDIATRTYYSILPLCKADPEKQAKFLSISFDEFMISPFAHFESELRTLADLSLQLSLGFDRYVKYVKYLQVRGSLRLCSRRSRLMSHVRHVCRSRLTRQTRWKAA